MLCAGVQEPSFPRGAEKDDIDVTIKKGGGNNPIAVANAGFALFYAQDGKF